MLTCSEELVKEQQPLHHTNHKSWRRLCYGERERERESVCVCVKGFCQLQSRGFAPGDHSILQHHAIPSGMQLVSQGFVLMQDDDPKQTSRLYQRYIKSKEEQHVLQLRSWPAHSADFNHIELVWDELDQKFKT